MSYLQLISENGNGAYYNVHFGDTINLKPNTKIGMVSLDAMIVYSIDFFQVLGNFPERTMRMIFVVGERPDNSIEIQIKITDSNFDGYNLHDIKFDELLIVINAQIHEAMLSAYPDGIGASMMPVYTISFFNHAGDMGGLGMKLIGNISRKENLNADVTDYTPFWDTDDIVKFDAVAGNISSPKSDGATSSIAPAYLWTDTRAGIDMNGGYGKFKINGEKKKWTIFFSNDDLDFTSTGNFDIDATDKDMIYCPVQIKSLGSDEGEMIHIRVHNGQKNYSTSPADADNSTLYRLHDIQDGDLFEIYINIDASMLIRHTRNDGDINDYVVDSLNQQYLWPAELPAIDNWEDGDIKMGIYTTEPNVKPIKELYYTNNNAISDDGNPFQFIWATKTFSRNDIFMQISWIPKDFASFLGFSDNTDVTMHPTDHGHFSEVSAQNVRTNSEGSISILNIHLINLPITSYKNTSTTALTNGFTTSLIGSMPITFYGKAHFSPVHLLYMDLKNPAESINELQVEIRDAITNKTTKLLSGTTILTLHLI